MSHDLFMGTVSLSPAPAHQPRLDVFMLTGFLLAFAQLTCFINRRQSRDMSVGLLVTSMALAVYAVMAGVWPLAMVQVALAVSAATRVSRSVRSLRRRSRRGRLVRHAPLPSVQAQRWSPNSRMTRMFGPPGSIN